MAMFGFRVLCQRAGLLIASATGHGSLPGAGPGLTIGLGALLRSTTAAGFLMAAIGGGLPDRWVIGTPTTLLRWWAGLAGRALASASDSAAADGVSASTS